jgi:hypothetical protein
MKTMLLLSEEPVVLQDLVLPIESRIGGNVYFTSPACLAVQRGPDFASMLTDDTIVADYEEGELERHGIDRDRVHTCAIAFRERRFLGEVLEAILPQIRTSWMDDDNGVILPLDEAVRWLRGGDHADRF